MTTPWESEKSAINGDSSSDISDIVPLLFYICPLSGET